MLRWIVPLAIVLPCGLVAFVLTPADPLSFYVGWAVLAVLALASSGLGWWVRGTMMEAKEGEHAP
jgi:hypothetical protein